MSDYEPGFYLVEKPSHKRPTYFQVTESQKAVIAYGDGQVARNDSAIILLVNDILADPDADISKVAREETPFETEVEPRPAQGPDPGCPV